MGLHAQNGRGTGVCGAGTGTCINSTVLTDEQKAIILDLCTTFQSEMSVLRAEMVASTVLADKLAIRAEMTALRTAHQAEIKALLDSWGLPSNLNTKTGTTGKGVQKSLKKGIGNGQCIK